MSNLSDAVKHNTYFEGKVQSLALDTEKGPATVGVMKKGEYLFNTSTPETITIISGAMNTKVGDAAWEKNTCLGKPFTCLRELLLMWTARPI